jgi:hypothetical protein
MTEAQDEAAATIGEEIEFLLAAGWTWDGDKLRGEQGRWGTRAQRV